MNERDLIRMDLSEMERRKQLEDENRRLKQIVTPQSTRACGQGRVQLANDV